MIDLLFLLGVFVGIILGAMITLITFIQKERIGRHVHYFKLNTFGQLRSGAYYYNYQCSCGAIKTITITENK